MNKTRALRGVLVAAAALALATSGSVLASSGASTDQASSLPSQSSQAAATCSPGSSACPIRITFAAGAYSGQAHAQLTGITSQRWFVVHARAGQTMVVVVEGRGPTRGVVYFPSGKSVGQPGGRVFDGVLPASGDYRIKVTESQMGQAWSGRVDVVTLIY